MPRINWSKGFFWLAIGRRYFQRLLGFATIGVKALVINDKNQVLLIEHTYIKGWHFPGGGVAQHEAPIDAIIRELQEETGILAKNPKLFAIYAHKICGARDYPLLYIVKDFTVLSDKLPCPYEIKQIAWFDLDKLPLETTDYTRRRLLEYQQNLPPAKYW